MNKDCKERAKQHIETIKKEYLSSPERTLSNNRNSLDGWIRMFPSTTHFVKEFIQNADDEESPHVKIEILNNEIKISNNGRPFSKEGVERICRILEGTKSAEYLTYLGIGFKSVFLISDCPQIYSICYQFKFDKNPEEWKDKSNLPWEIIPVWIDKEINLDKWNTIFVIPIKQNVELEKLGIGEDVKLRTMLFFQKIDRIEIIDGNQNIKRELIKNPSPTSNMNEGYEIYSLQEFVNEELNMEEKWLVFSLKISPPPEVKRDAATINWSRGKIEKREVRVAFKLDEEGNLIEEKGTIHMGVFSLATLKEYESGFKFIMSGDLMVNPNREDPIRVSKWNDWLVNETFNLLVKKCIPAFEENENWKFSFTTILSSEEIHHELFRSLREKIEGYLNKEPVYVCEDGSLWPREKMIKILPEIRGLLSDENVTNLFPGKKVLHPQSIIYENIIDEFPKKDENMPEIYLFIKDERSEDLMKLKTESNEIDWFVKIYNKLFSIFDANFFYRYHGYTNWGHWVDDRKRDFWRWKLQDKVLILTDKNEVVTSRYVWVKTEGLSLSEPLSDKYKCVHPEIVNKCKEFLNQLEVNELTEEKIKDDLKSQDILKVDKKGWKKLSKKKKINAIKDCKDLWSKELLREELPSTLSEIITLKTKSGEWVKPSKIIFSKEYNNPNHRIESILENGLLKGYENRLKFLSPEFIENESNIDEWRNFFLKLGIEKELEKEKDNMTAQIGKTYALECEKSKGRKLKVLSIEEERIEGCDIISKDKNGDELLIEVKGSAEKKPKPLLGKTQTTRLLKDTDKYWVYVVTNSLYAPALYRIPGKKIVETHDFRTEIPSSLLDDPDIEIYSSSLA